MASRGTAIRAEHSVGERLLRRHVRNGQYVPRVRLIVARCEVTYKGRAAAFLPGAVRLVMLKGDGTVMIWDDGGSYKVKPLNSST